MRWIRVDEHMSGEAKASLSTFISGFVSETMLLLQAYQVLHVFLYVHSYELYICPIPSYAITYLLHYILVLILIFSRILAP